MALYEIVLIIPEEWSDGKNGEEKHTDNQKRVADSKPVHQVTR